METSAQQRCAHSIGAFLMIAMAAAIIATSAAAAPTPGSVVEGPAAVVDGDTIEIAGQRIRLDAIDAPEANQSCGGAHGELVACGQAATRALRDLIGQESLACESVGTDKYGRMLGLCFLDGEDINRFMVESGNAWAYLKYSTKYVSAEADARASKIGIWQGETQPAWKYRKAQWQVAEVAAPAGCAIKGNMSKQGRIYHVPWSAWYDKVKIDEARGERWFCSEDEALQAGWRPAAPQ